MLQRLQVALWVGKGGCDSARFHIHVHTFYSSVLVDAEYYEVIRVLVPLVADEMFC